MNQNIEVGEVLIFHNNFLNKDYYHIVVEICDYFIRTGYYIYDEYFRSGQIR